MAISRARRPVESTLATAGETNDFTIAVNSRAFGVLLDTLYTNKVRAVIRELWTNAYDSHVAAGNADQPFHCKLPTTLDQTFSVRDYGVSMTHDEVMHLYTTVFQSTKDETNELVGQLGLGSKSPFAYTDAFTITAWLDGERRVYVAALGADGVPSITCLSTEPDDKPRGVEVSFPVQTQHLDEFRHEAAVVVEGFRVPPTIDGPELRIQERTELLSGPGWTLQETYEGRGIHVRQGCVIYPVSTAVTRSHLDTLRANHRLVVDVPIGSCEVAASREALSLDDDTLEVVNAAVGAAVAEIVHVVTRDQCEATTLLEAERAYLRATKVLNLSRQNQYYETGKFKHRLSGLLHLDRNNADVPRMLDHVRKPRDPAFHVDQLPRYRFVIDRSDQKVLRRWARFRAFRDELGYHHHLVLLPDPTPQQLARLVRRLDLKPEQLVSLASLPDVKVERVARDVKLIGGVYPVPVLGTHERFDPQTVTELDRRYLWVSINKVSDREYDLGPMGRPHRDAAVRLIRRLADELGIKETIYLMSRGAQKRLGVRECDSFLARVAELEARDHDDLVESLTARAALDHLRAYRRFDDSVLNELLSDSFTKVTTLAERRSTLERLVPVKDRVAAERRGKTIANQVMREFPLLFGAASNADLVQYINDTRS